MKDQNTIQGGERINSKVVTSDCYSFRVLSHRDSPQFLGKIYLVLTKSFLKCHDSSGPLEKAGLRMGGRQESASCISRHQPHGHDAGGMALFGGWEKWSCSDSETTETAQKNYQIWTIQSYLRKKEIHVIRNWNSMNMFLAKIHLWRAFHGLYK